MSKSSWNTVLTANIKSTGQRFITALKHRTVLTSLRDFIGWLDEVNTWTAINVFNAGTRTPWSHITGTGTQTITSSLNHQIIDQADQVNAPPTPEDGEWYTLKNKTGANVTLSGNGKNIYTSSANATRTIVAGGSYKIIYDSTDDQWINTI